jgi:hypothetical protein
MLDQLDDKDETHCTTMPFLLGYRVWRYLGPCAFSEIWLADDL